ncbi:MAG TPA: protein kinase [Kofleriaceae bacterium]|nr:protein kinase [Kofleriaceae bacterium]
MPSWVGRGMGDAVRDGEVRAADPEDTIDANDRAREAPVAAIDVVVPARDYAQLTTVERRHYLVTGELATGGMGRVLEARDLRLGRDVAIKELLPKNRDAARRFEREARITARLQHPSIIHVYEAGVWPGGEPFYAMPRVSGRSLDKVVGEKQTLAERLALLPHVIAVADALAYAHNENVIHRDLKPANVLVGEYGETVVIDWGLAKDLGAPSDPKESLALRLRATAEETASGSIVGTPAYMPPEQARGEAVDQRADVYALGALLYKLLAGVPPYTGEHSRDVLELVKAGPPRPVHEVVPDAPPELVAIVNQAMQRDPDDRYITASALAQDLKRFETGQLVGAHRYTVSQLVVRWLRRYRLAVGVGAAALVAMVVLGVISVSRIVTEKHRAEAAQAKAQAGRIELLQEHGRSELLAGRSGAALAYLVGASEDGNRGGARGFLIADAMRPFDAEIAHIEVGKGNVTLAVRDDGTELVTSGAGDVVLWSADGKQIRSFGGRGTSRVVAIDQTGARVVAAGDDGVAHVWARDGSLVADLQGGTGPINAAVFSRDGKRLVTGGEDGSVIVWDLATKAKYVSASDTCHSAPVVSLELSASGSEVLSASADATACVLSVVDGSVQKQLRGHRGRINAATWSSDGKSVITASDDATARVWNVDTERTVPIAKPSVAPLAHMQGAGVNVALLLDEQRAVTAGADGVVYIWSLPAELPVGEAPPAARVVRRFVAHTGSVVAAAVSADGRFMATGGYDALAKIWDLQTGQQIATFEHADVVTSVRFVGGTTLATASRDGTVRLWNTATIKIRHELDSVIHAIAIAHDGTVAVATDDSRVTLVRAGDTAPLAGHLGRVFAVAFAPAKALLVSGGEDAESIVWDTDKRVPVARLAIPTPVRELAISGDEDTVVALAGDHVELWSIASKSRKLVLPSNAKRLDAVAINPRDGSFAAVGASGALVQWSASGEKLVEISDAARPYSALAFSKNGTILVAAGPGLADVWRVHDGKLSFELALDGATGIVRAAAVTDDSSMIVTAGDDGRAYVWDAERGKRLGSRDYHERPVSSVRIDGDTLWVASEDGTLDAWDIHVDTRSAAELAAAMKAKHVPEYLDADTVVRAEGNTR